MKQPTMANSPQLKQPTWQKAFDTKFVNPPETNMRGMTLNNEPVVIGKAKDVKAFFTTVLEELAADVERGKSIDGEVLTFEDEGYNQALDDILKLIQTKYIGKEEK